MQNCNGIILILESSTTLKVPLPKIFDYLNINENTHFVIDQDQIENLMKYIRTFDQLKHLVKIIVDGHQIQQQKIYTIKDKIDLFYQLIICIYNVKDQVGLAGIVKRKDELLKLFTQHRHSLGKKLILSIMDEAANQTDEITKRYILKIFSIIISKKIIFPQFVYALDYDVKQGKLRIESSKSLIEALKEKQLFFNQPTPSVILEEDEIIEHLLIQHTSSALFLEFAQTQPPQVFGSLILAQNNSLVSALLAKIKEYGNKQFNEIKDKRDKIQIKLAYIYMGYCLKKNIVDISFIEFITFKCEGDSRNYMLTLNRIPDLLNRILHHKSFRKFNEETHLRKVLHGSIQIDVYVQEMRKFNHLVHVNQQDTLIKLLMIFDFMKNLFHHKIIELQKKNRIRRQINLMKSYQGNSKTVQFGINLYISLMEPKGQVSIQATASQYSQQLKKHSQNSYCNFMTQQDEQERLNKKFKIDNQFLPEQIQNQQLRSYQSQRYPKFDNQISLSLETDLKSPITLSDNSDSACIINIDELEENDENKKKNEYKENDENELIIQGDEIENESLQENEEDEEDEEENQNNEEYEIHEDNYEDEEIEQNEKNGENEEIEQNVQNFKRVQIKQSEESELNIQNEESEEDKENEHKQTNHLINIDSEDERFINSSSQPLSITGVPIRKEQQTLYIIQKLLENKEILPQIVNFVKLNLDAGEFRLSFNFTEELYNALETSQEAYLLIKNNLQTDKPTRIRLFSIQEIQCNIIYLENEMALIMQYINLLNTNKKIHSRLYLRNIKQCNIIYMLKQLTKYPKQNGNYRIQQFKQDLEQINIFLDSYLQLPL